MLEDSGGQGEGSEAGTEAARLAGAVSTLSKKIVMLIIKKKADNDA